MTMVAALFAAINRGDVDAASRLYSDDCVVELSFAGDEPLHRGRPAVVAAFQREQATYNGSLPGECRFNVDQIAGIETGWGWVRAVFVRGLRRVSDGAETIESGYAYFWIEDGAIRRQRTIIRTPSDRSAAPAAKEPPPAHGRRYPAKPVLGVGGVVFDDDGDVLLVKRKYEPLAQQWSLPGGGLDAGESLEAGTAREILEETGIVVRVGPLIEVFDRILLDDDANVRYHFVLVDYLCQPIGGTLAAHSDASDVAWVPVARLPEYAVAEKARDVIARAVVMKESLPW